MVLAEEWQTVDAVLHLHWLLRYRGMRDRVTMLWNANNTFGFDQIPWPELAAAARITTVSRYMKHRMREWGVEASVIPNGLGAEAFDVPPRGAVVGPAQPLPRPHRAQQDGPLGPGQALDRDRAHGGRDEAAGLAAAPAGPRGQRAVRRGRVLRGGTRDGPAGRRSQPGNGRVAEGLLDAVARRGRCGHREPALPRRPRGAPCTLFRSTDAVLANSGHEPFGLVGLEAMAAGGIACTGCSGEDYAVPGQNALVLETGEPREFMSLYRQLRGRRGRGAPTAGGPVRPPRGATPGPTWLRSVLLPRVELGQEIG